jgi:hypothetical protein
MRAVHTIIIEKYIPTAAVIAAMAGGSRSFLITL